MTITFESPDQPEVIALIAELDAYQDTLYPPESRYALDLTSLKQPNVLFAVARDDAGQARTNMRRWLCIPQLAMSAGDRLAITGTTH